VATSVEATSVVATSVEATSVVATSEVAISVVAISAAATSDPGVWATWTTSPLTGTATGVDEVDDTSPPAGVADA
jgi:hypothetical protein